jgi:hypothetical protein
MSMEPKIKDCPECGRTAKRYYNDTPISYWGDGWTKQRKFGHDDKFNLK